MRNWQIYLVHHSHTDIGYTERQEKLTRYHVDFIRQAMNILDNIKSGKLDARGFKWQIENMWQIDNFYLMANPEEQRKFEQYVKNGDIGLSGNYLNMTELVDFEVLQKWISRARDYADARDLRMESGMSADINGYAWGYADALSSNGIKNLFCALHPHHGMFPLEKKHQPFFWQGPKGGKVLTWIGEHYHFGNELGFAPHASSSYMIFDDIRSMRNSGRYFSTDAETTMVEEERILATRVSRFLEGLEKEGYPYNFVPIMVSGCITDNAPPSAETAKRVQRLPKLLPGVSAQMATLDDFFDCVRANAKDIPTYSGDFPDWWADGIGSTANTVKIFRDAQRKYDLCRKLDPKGETGDAQLMEAAERNIMLYAEHTWGYSSSISEPWDSMVASLEKKKDAYAVSANTVVSKNLDTILASRGEVTIAANRPQRFKVVNPHAFAFHGTAKLYVEFWEYVDGLPFDPSAHVVVTDTQTGVKLPCQHHKISRAYEIEVALHLPAGGEKMLELHQSWENSSTLLNYPHVGADGIRDVVTTRALPEMPFLIESDYFKVVVAQKEGITSIIDKNNGSELVLPGENAFCGIREVTPADDAHQCDVRRRMGRSRRCISTRRSVSVLIDSRIVESGDVYVTVRLSYSLKGFKFYDVYLKLYKHSPMLEARICFHKDSVWSPENVYVALPFRTNGSNETWIDKTGCIMRPGLDQLLNTCQDFYLLQNGFVRKGQERDIIVACKDAPLITFGPHQVAPTVLCRGESDNINQGIVHSWIMNNYWETNFKADLGGFYEFSYTLLSVKPDTVENEFELCRMLNEGILGFYC